MSPEEALRSLRRFMTQSHNVNLAVLARRERKKPEEESKPSQDKPGDEGPEEANDEEIAVVQRLRLHASLARQFGEIAKSFSASLQGKTIRRYDPGYKPDAHEIVYIRIGEAPELGGIVKELAAFDELAFFEEDDEVIRFLKFYAIIVESAKRKALFFRHYSQKKELSRTRRFAVVHSKGAYDKIATKVFLFDSDVDCVAWEGYMFISNVHQYHLMFRYLEALRKKSTKTLNTILKHVPVVNEDEFKVACASLPMMAKLVSIAARPYLSKITLAKLEVAIKKYNLGIEVRSQGGKRGLVFEPSPEKRWAILRLLDDGYLESIMTSQHYEVNSKIPI